MCMYIYIYIYIYIFIHIYICINVCDVPSCFEADCHNVPVSLADILKSQYPTVLHRGMGTGPMGTILRFASVPPRKMGTLVLGSWWP